MTVEMTTFNTYMFLIGLTLFAIIAIFLVYAEMSGDRERKRQAEKPQYEKATEEKATPDPSVENIIYLPPEPTPAEKALLLASHQSFRLNMDAMEAHRLLAEAAQRHEHDPAPADWYVDAEWKL